MTEPIKLLHFSDVHIGMENYGRLDPESGLNSRVLDFLRRLNEAVDIGLENEVDACIFTGDAYKNQRPNPTLQREFCRRIKRLADAGVPVILLVGNHDLPAADRAATSIDIFGVLDVPHVIVVNREKVHQVKCRRGQMLQVAAIPYPQRSRLLTQEQFRALSITELDKALEDIISRNIQDLAAEVGRQPEIPAVLAAHFSVSEAKLGSEQNVMIGRDLVVKRGLLINPAWKYVALGHIHRHQNLNPNNDPPLVYSGSLERIDFGEENEEKGVVLATIYDDRPADWKFIPVAARPFKTIRVDVRDSADPLPRVLDAIERADIAEAIVRVIIQAEEEQKALLDEKPMREALASARYIAAISYDIKPASRHRLHVENAETLKPLEALSRYLEAKEVTAERRERLLAAAEELMKESD